MLPYINPIQKPSKREVKKQFKILLGKYSSGLISGHRYKVLTAAKKYSEKHGLEFPGWAKHELARTAQNLLFDFIDYSQPRFKQSPVQLSLKLSYGLKSDR